MNLARFAALLLATALPALAGLNTAVIVLPTENTRSAPAVNLVQPADYLCAVVTLRSAAKDVDRQSAAMRDSLQRLTAAIEKSPRFQLHQGPARFALSPNPLFSSKTESGAASIQTNLRVLASLQGNQDVFETMRQLRRFIGSLSLADDTTLNIVSISLAVTEPEQYRARLLSLIADQARAIQQNFATRAIIIDGLQNPVVVRQIDDANVELFVEYQLSATLDSR